MVYFLIPFFLCWGSFLNMLSYRLIHGIPIVGHADAIPLGGHSRCPHCSINIPWHDLVPLFSWLYLNGSCRSCHKPISLLYPFIELLTAALGICTYLFIPPTYWLGYGLFISALIVSIRSDLDSMLISRAATLYLVPLGLIFSFYGSLPISAAESALGALSGYGLLWLIATLFTRFTGKHGIGLGDFDLLCFIGAFTGPLGVWISLMIASVTGSLSGLSYLMITRKPFTAKIPFGPFLSLGALVFLFFAPTVTSLFIGFPIHLFGE